MKAHIAFWKFVEEQGTTAGKSFMEKHKRQKGKVDDLNLWLSRRNGQMNRDLWMALDAHVREKYFEENPDPDFDLTIKSSGLQDGRYGKTKYKSRPIAEKAPTKPVDFCSQIHECHKARTEWITSYFYYELLRLQLSISSTNSIDPSELPKFITLCTCRALANVPSEYHSTVHANMNDAIGLLVSLQGSLDTLDEKKEHLTEMEKCHESKSNDYSQTATAAMESVLRELSEKSISLTEDFNPDLPFPKHLCKPKSYPNFVDLLNDAEKTMEGKAPRLMTTASAPSSTSAAVTATTGSPDDPATSSASTLRSAPSVMAHASAPRSTTAPLKAKKNATKFLTSAAPPATPASATSTPGPAQPPTPRRSTRFKRTTETLKSATVSEQTKRRRLER